jgi:hypothetical protein
MNENIIADLGDEFTAHFLPELKCQMCPRLTFIGQIERDRSSYILRPLCPIHGYFEAGEHATPHARQEEYKSIERFVRYALGNRGAAHVIEWCLVEDIPGYNAEYHATSNDIRNGFKPMGWKVLYQLKSDTRYVHVVYDYRAWSFTLYENNTRIEERA